ncbi:hypothetical protein DPPLL_32190 [Desulfofustis limnaeus]|uniref:Uncharacterized protein n=1 Tax=Desulfofustis limnaeus TaxID=2740163 RepID=A0ABM7WCY5_9BACT|nr:hypothetical protein DPPLL_32190 [Desulfofustis limnaeus]
MVSNLAVFGIKPLGALQEQRQRNGANVPQKILLGTRKGTSIEGVGSIGKQEKEKGAKRSVSFNPF